MDSGRVHETSWPEEYATGRLPAEQRVAFESHLVGCPECLDRVESAERMQAGLQELERRRPAIAPPSSRRLAAPRWATRVAWAMAATAAVAVAVWSGVQGTRRTEAALARERDALARTEAELARTRAELERARKPPEVTPPAPSRTTGRVPVLALMTTRGSDLPSVVLPPPGQPVALWVERELPVRFERYHVAIRSEQGADVFQDDVTPATRDALLVALDASLLPAGRYTLSLEGEGRGGRRVPVAQHPFRTLPVPVR
ncbi:MAG TPA: zf-HC2 domain-containing protein [Myxococcaceae bacterium]|nr:zf-HC2 domain-containing protein [Myxococcaceae bacterium]